MYLTDWNSVADAIEWLTQIGGDCWSWRSVLDQLAKTDPDTVGVVLRANTKLTQLGPGEIREIMLTHPRMMEVCNVQQFLSDMLMADDLATASASPLALIDSGSRYRPSTPTPIASLRLRKDQIHRVAALQSLYPWKLLLRSLKQGKQPALAALLSEHSATSESSNAFPKENLKNQQVRAVPSGGDSLTPLIWEICFDLRGSEKKVTARPVMAILKELASATPKQHPLVGATAGGVKFEFERGDEKELTSSALTGRIKTWREQNSA